MCKWDTTIPLEVTVPAHLSHTGKPRLKVVGIDSCIYSIVKALNGGGVHTIACCCGHGKGPGGIHLKGGRELLVVTKEQSLKIAGLLMED